MATPLSAGREQVLAFRLEGHHLARRLPARERSFSSGLLAAGACGMQNTPPGAALLSLHARLEALPPGALDHALETEKSLLQTWSLRGSPHIFPSAQAAVFTRGLLPRGEEELLGFIPGVEQGLARTGLSAGELVERTRQAVLEELDGRALANKRRLDAALAGRVRAGLPAAELPAWDSESPYAEGQTMGEALVSFALRPVALLGCICFAPRRGNEASFVRPDQWLGASIPADEGAGVELVRRYLSCYGPSRVGHFAAWVGISDAHASRLWQPLAGEMVPVAWSGGKTDSLLASDLPRFASPERPQGVRFLPAHDPYLQCRDHATLAPDPARQRRVWRSAGSPGALLVDGELAGVWQAQKKARRLLVRIEPFFGLSGRVRETVADAAAELAALRGCERVEVLWSAG